MVAPVYAVGEAMGVDGLEALEKKPVPPVGLPADEISVFKLKETAAQAEPLVSAMVGFTLTVTVAVPVLLLPGCPLALVTDTIV